MANTLHGPYTETAWTNGTTPVSQTNMNHLETQSAVALNSFNGDLLSAFVLSGVTCTKDGTTASQLDVASGYAYLTQSDGTLARCDVGSTTFSTSGNLSTTMYLDLNPDGSWSWATSHSATTNHLTICSVVTDASGNISTVTDARPIATTLFGGGSSPVYFPAQIEVGALNGSLSASANMGTLYYSTGGGALVVTGAHTGAGQGVVLQAFDTSVAYNVLGIGAPSVTAKTAINTSGTITTLASQATAGSFGVPVIVAQALAVNVTATTAQTIINYAPSAAGMYRCSLYITMKNGSNAALSAYVHWADQLNGGSNAYFTWAATTPVVMNGSNSVSTNQGIGCAPLTFYAQTGTNIVVYYIDPTGTPNDYVTAILERLS